MKTIYQQIKAIAAPVVKHYQTDVTVHDRKSCGLMRTGDVAFWAPREMGSHFIVYDRAGTIACLEAAANTRRGMEYFEACQKIYPGMQWYLLESTDGAYGHVVTVDPEYIKAAFRRRIQALERQVLVG